MPKFYYHPYSSAVASFIAAVAAGLHFDVEQVSIYTDHKTDSGADYYTINPKGNVPCLVLDDGTVLNESSAVLQYIADQVPGKLAGANGTTVRYEVQNMLNYLASEVQVAYHPLFSVPPGEAKDALLQKVAAKLAYIENHVLKTNYLIGDSFTIADAQFQTILSWNDFVGVELSSFPKIKAYSELVSALPFVVEAHSIMATNPASI